MISLQIQDNPCVRCLENVVFMRVLLKSVMFFRNPKTADFLVKSAAFLIFLALRIFRGDVFGDVKLKLTRISSNIREVLLKIVPKYSMWRLEHLKKPGLGLEFSNSNFRRLCEAQSCFI